MLMQKKKIIFEKLTFVACMKINIIGAIFKHKNNGLFRELSKSAKEFKISMPMKFSECNYQMVPKIL